MATEIGSGRWCGTVRRDTRGAGLLRREGGLCGPDGSEDGSG
jgi:hypothetical protein